MAKRFNWGTGITLVYIAFASGTIGMVGLAMSLPQDLVSDDYYSQSLTYDERIAAIERADALGVALRCDVDARAHLLTVMLPPDQTDAHGQIALYRPSSKTADRAYPLTVTPDGTQHVLLPATSGVWHVRLEWSSRGQTFYRERVVVLP